MHLPILLCCLALAVWAPVHAANPPAEVAGVRLAERVRVAGQHLVLNGAGLRQFLFMKVYVAALYLPERHHDAHAILDGDMPRGLWLTLLRDISAEQNVEVLKVGLIDNNGPEVMHAIQADVERFLGYIRSLREVSAGTEIHLDYLVGVGTRVSVNGRLLGTVPGEAFNRALLRIWLGDAPVQANLKQALLGES